MQVLTLPVSQKKHTFSPSHRPKLSLSPHSLDLLNMYRNQKNIKKSRLSSKLWMMSTLAWCHKNMYVNVQPPKD